MDVSTRKIPVFVFPTSLTFYLNTRASHKQLLTLYNPYDFPVRFKVLCTSPNKYTVIDPDGSIGPQSCVDIVIRHVMPISANCNVTDKFRISMQDHTTKQTLGKRDIPVKLLPGEQPDSSSNDGTENFQSLPHNDKGSEEQRNMQYQIHNFGLGQRRFQTAQNQTNYFAILAGLICIFALLLPTKQEIQEESKIPSYFHLSVNLKLVFAYALGLVSMVVFRP